MSTKFSSRLSVILLTIVLIASLAIGVWLDRANHWPRAIDMMKILPGDSAAIEYSDYDEARPSLRAAVFKGLDVMYGQDLGRLYGRGRCYFDSADSASSQLQTLTIYEGDVDRASMMRAMEDKSSFAPATQYGGILVWTATEGSVALISGFIVSGNTTLVQQCVEAAQGKTKSLYDNPDARDVLSRLPADQSFYLTQGTLAARDEPGRLAMAVTSRLATTYAATTVEKHVDVDSAAASVAKLEAEREQRGSPTSFKIAQDGVFVTSSQTVYHGSSPSGI